MGHKDDLKARAAAAGLPTSGTIADLEERLAGHEPDDPTPVPARYIGETIRTFPHHGVVGPGDIIYIPRRQIETNPLLESAADETPDQ